jgi:hypothetical protein
MLVILSQPGRLKPQPPAKNPLCLDLRAELIYSNWLEDLAAPSVPLQPPQSPCACHSEPAWAAEAAQPPAKNPLRLDLHAELIYSNSLEDLAAPSVPLQPPQSPYACHSEPARAASAAQPPAKNPLCLDLHAELIYSKLGQCE